MIRLKKFDKADFLDFEAHVDEETLRLRLAALQFATCRNKETTRKLHVAALNFYRKIESILYQPMSK